MLLFFQEMTPEKRICFMYVLANGTFSWTVDKTACLRNIRSAQNRFDNQFSIYCTGKNA